jgi:hypothetical protein
VAASLLKRAVTELQKTFPSIQTHSTLSPIPGFKEWLMRQGRPQQSQVRRAAIDSNRWSVFRRSLIGLYLLSQVCVDEPLRLPEELEVEVTTALAASSALACGDRSEGGLVALCRALEKPTWHRDEALCGNIKRAVGVQCSAFHVLIGWLYCR